MQDASSYAEFELSACHNKRVEIIRGRLCAAIAILEVTLQSWGLVLANDRYKNWELEGGGGCITVGGMIANMTDMHDFLCAAIERWNLAEYNR